VKKLFILFIIAIIGIGGYFGYAKFFNIEKGIPKIEVEEELANIDEYYIYGNHFNLKGSLTLEDATFSDIKLVLYNGEFSEVELNYNLDVKTINFYISNLINDGLYLEDIALSDYYLFIRLEYEVEDSEEVIYKYYVLNNNTSYEKTEYYTMSYVGNKILVTNDNEYNTMMFKMTQANYDGVYDIVIDPGHGGMDGGGFANGYKESDFTMNISIHVKQKLEELGLKVKLTREEDSLGPNDLLDEYNTHGRAIIPYEVKAKYLFSIHINKNQATYVKGVEVYTPSNINYDLAKSIANNIVNETGLSYSNNRTFKEYDGVYTHNFTEAEIASALSSYADKGYEVYDVTTNSNYLYMIRETGGFMTGAYVDSRNKDKVGVNPYCNSNIGVEAYLMEIGYISNSSDLDILINNEEKIADAIVNSIKTELNM